jgi:HEAT repeat protein
VPKVPPFTAGGRWIALGFAVAFAGILPVETAWSQTAPAQTVPAGDTPQSLGDLLLRPDAGPEARIAAAGRLAAMRSPAAVSVLVKTLQSTDTEISAAAAKAVYDADWADPQFIAPMESLLGSSLPLNTYAVRILVQFPGNSVVAAKLLEAAFDDQVPAAARVPLVGALGSFPSKDAAEALVNVLANIDESAELRQAAAVALAAMSGRRNLGQDPQNWQDWWQSVNSLSPSAFLAALQAQRAAGYAGVVADADRLDRGADRLLKSLYFTAAPDGQGRLLDSYFASDVPEIRRTGAEIVEIDVGGGRPMTAAARSRLLTLLGNDPSPQVRVAAATALGLDPTAAGEMIARLNSETNPDALIALLEALAPRQNPAAITIAVGLLAHAPAPVARSAADLIAASGATLADPKQSALKQQVESALITALDAAGTPATAALRRSVTAALGALGDTGLYERFVRLASASEPEGVRAEAIGALGTLARQNADITATVADFVDAPNTPPALRLRAVRELARIPTTAYVDRLVDRLQKSPEPRADIREAIWQTVQAWMPIMGDDRLVRLAERLRDEHDYAHEVDARRFYATQLETRKTDDAMQTAASQWETIATREMDDLQKPADAAADFARVCAYYLAHSAPGDDLPHNPFRGEAAALLAGGPPYEPAVKFAADTLFDPKRISVVPDVLEEFPRLANTLATADPPNRQSLANALQLVKAFDDAKMSVPPSLSYVTDNLAAAGEAARRNLSAMGNGP